MNIRRVYYESYHRRQSHRFRREVLPQLHHREPSEGAGNEEEEEIYSPLPTTKEELHPLCGNGGRSFRTRGIHDLERNCACINQEVVEPTSTDAKLCQYNDKHCNSSRHTSLP
uniref:Uncharacterized protein n=1 Tax=Ditylum brightwellii TaxID=49249 RepID=A0A7S4RDM8_9STRA|mmetsp:Transcript_5612/g.7274  ORF Transcript_5612/g.7274 Transcript_5612/m.7274 type:complete len:113 (+) Transcript_5612:172-510(+)